MNIEQLKQDIEKAQGTIEASEKFIAETEQAIADRLCPFHVGQAVRSKCEGVCVVASIHYRPWRANNYGVRVFKTKKGGGLFKVSVWVYDELEAVGVNYE